MAASKKTKFKGRKSKVDAVAHLVGKVPDKELAQQVGVSTENVRSWRTRRGIAADWMTPDVTTPVAAKPVAVAKPTGRRKKGAGRRKSKLDPWTDELGKVPDRVIAEKAGVSPENVRAYRKRHGIAASWRAEGSPAAPMSKAPAATKPVRVAKPKPKPKKARGVRRRKSKLDPWFSELGAVEDTVIAEKAGVSPENVRAYRKRHGIESSWRAETAASEAPAAKASARTKVAAPASQRKRRTVSESAPPATPARPPSGVKPRGWAFRVTADVDGTEREYVTFGGDVVEAAQTARDRLAGIKKDAVIKKLEVMGVAL